MKNIISGIIIISILLQFIYATTIEVSPSQIVFNQKINEERCVQVTIRQDQKQNLTLQDVWKNEEASNELSEYNLIDKPVKITYNPQISGQESDQKICITPKKENNFSGIILITSETKNAAVGLRIEVKPSLKESVNDNKSMLLNGSITMLLTNILIILLLKITTKQQKKNSFERNEKRT